MKNHAFKLMGYLSLFLLLISIPTVTSAHRSGCHRWHSCPSDTGSYVEGDAGYVSQYPTYKDGVTTYPNNPYYRTEYQGTIYATPGYSSFSSSTFSDQTKLIELGYLVNSKADGKKGPKTTQAIKMFQIKNGITPDGIVGPITSKLLHNN